MSSSHTLVSPIKVIVVAAVRLYRDGLASSLLTYRRLTILGTASSRVDATSKIAVLLPDVVVIDIAMPDALDLIRDLHVQVPSTRLVAFAVNEDVPTIVRCAEAGATSYVTVDASLDDFVSAIESSAVGELSCSPRIAAELFSWLGKRSERKDVSDCVELLTNREHGVLAFITEGLSNKEIATQLNISEATVKNHVHRLLEKLHVDSRRQAALVFSPGRRRNSSGVSPMRSL